MLRVFGYALAEAMGIVASEIFAKEYKRWRKSHKPRTRPKSRRLVSRRSKRKPAA